MAIKFILSGLGYIGLGPLVVKTNYMICVLKDCNMPMVIREERSHHHLIRVYFVWRLMDGEVVKSRVSNGRVFHLR